MEHALTIGFLGAGKMATALAAGMVRSGLILPGNCCASDPYPAALQNFKDKTGAHVLDSNVDLVRKSRLVFLAVKPGQVVSLLEEIQGVVRVGEQVFVSIAAGIQLKTLESHLPPETALIRVMPNTPALVGAAASGFSANAFVGEEMIEWVERLLSSIGIASRVPESLLDAVTGLSGSGPAYVYQFIEAMSDGGVAAGLPRETATRLAAQTVLGAAKMVLETGLHPGALKDMVTSPGGTTIEGIQALEEKGLRAAVIHAVRRASEKSRQLGVNQGPN